MVGGRTPFVLARGGSLGIYQVGMLRALLAAPAALVLTRVLLV